MNTITISQAAKRMGISTRMLRYYEQEGLIQSHRRDDYAYRVYDEEAVSRIAQIIILRKLRIPVRQIRIILENQSAIAAIDIFRQNIDELDEEITALSTIKELLFHFIRELTKATQLPLTRLLEDHDELQTALKSLQLISINFKEEQGGGSLKKADQKLSKIEDVRIVYLPPSAVVSAHVIGEEPEMQVNQMLDKFVLENKVHLIKPDLRHYGFNHPNPIDETGYHGYEAWVTIPEHMDVRAPLVKKQFTGGLYGAHMIRFGDFSAWDALLHWVNNSDQYEFAGNIQDQEHMCGLLEEHINYFSHLNHAKTDINNIQLDLLVPLKKR